jgi:hypothetical protein
VIVAVASVKGSPGATSTALVLASVWGTQPVLLEADPDGGDLAYRCRAAHGGSMHAGRSMITLAAAVRAGMPAADALVDHSQRLSCGVDVVQGVTSASQAEGIEGLWPQVAAACGVADRDVIVDLGRLSRRDPTLVLARAADRLLLVANPTLASAVHVADALPALAEAIGADPRRGFITPVLVGPDASAHRDSADFDDIVRGTGVPVTKTRSVPYDPAALQRLESGERPTGRLGRTLLVRAARRLSAEAAPSREPAAT